MKYYTLLILLLIPLVAADGMILRPAPTMNWELSSETSQRAIIANNDGFETMLLAIDAQASPGSVWIFPVPASPNQTSIEIIAELPELYSFRHKDLEYAVYNGLRNAHQGLGFHYLLTVPPMYILMSQNTFSNDRALQGGVDDVVVHKTVTYSNLELDLISAVSPDSLFDFLQSDGVVLPEALKDGFAYYTGLDYSFVVARILDDPEYASLDQSVLGAQISFPTNKTYFPLRLTSAYDTDVVPATIVVLGHVNPNLYDEIKNYSKVHYYYSSTVDDIYYNRPNSSQPKTKKAFANVSLQANAPYTLIEINAPAASYVEDLWMDEELPDRIIVMKSMYAKGWIWVSILFLAVNVLSTIIASLIVKRKVYWQFFPYALINIFGGLLFWIIFMASDAAQRSESGIIQKIKLPAKKRLIILSPLLILLAGFLLFVTVNVLDLYMYNRFLTKIFNGATIIILMYAPLILWGIFSRRTSLYYLLSFSTSYYVLLTISYYTTRALLGF